MKFKCGRCGKGRMEEVVTGATQSTSILGVDDDGLLIYGDTSTEGGDLDRFQCADCGNVIKDGKGKIIASLDMLAEFLAV